MRKIALLTVAAVTLITVFTFASARATAHPRVQGGGSKLEGFMGEIDGVVKGLEKVVESKTGIAATMADVIKLQKLAIDAKSELPSALSAITEAKALKKATLSYKTQMQNLVRASLDLETAVLNEDVKGAAKALREFDKLKSAGHSEFRKEDGK